jgi:hypothetical protein
MVLEVQRTDNLYFLIDEMQRWRGIIGDKYIAHKQAKSSQYA